MASSSLHNGDEYADLPEERVEELKRLVWGQNLKDEVFERWTQGYVFSDDEPTALLQFNGGPCAVIAPVQSFIIKHALFSDDSKDDLKTFTSTECKSLLVSALVDIMASLSTHSYTVVLFQRDNTEVVKANDKEEEDKRSSKRQKCGPSSVFHSSLRYCHCDNKGQLKGILTREINSFDDYGILLFLYSVLLTKGVDVMKEEMEDADDPLIDGVHGHGSQSLVNLLLCGRASSNVFDGEQEVAGLKLHGILRQPNIGFLTKLEHLRYCEVGSFLKCPLFPVWLLGSETHLTVLFSKDMSLVAPESQEAIAKRVFKSYDPEGNGFISTVLLGDVLQLLNLVSVPEYVDIMQKKLDPDDYGIILQSAFMSEFFPQDEDNSLTQFQLYHYNGLQRSNSHGKVQYAMGRAHIEHGPIQCQTDLTPIVTVIQTKWPSAEVTWDDHFEPSLN